MRASLVSANALMECEQGRVSLTDSTENNDHHPASCAKQSLAPRTPEKELVCCFFSVSLGEDIVAYRALYQRQRQQKNDLLTLQQHNFQQVKLIESNRQWVALGQHSFLWVMMNNNVGEGEILHSFYLTRICTTCISDLKNRFRPRQRLACPVDVTPFIVIITWILPSYCTLHTPHNTPPTFLTKRRRCICGIWGVRPLSIWSCCGHCRNRCFPHPDDR